MNSIMFWFHDVWGRWAIDRAGVQTGRYSAHELREMVDRDELDPHNWLRHSWTGRYSLVGEVLYGNQEATSNEFETWFPKPEFKPITYRSIF